MSKIQTNSKLFKMPNSSARTRPTTAAPRTTQLFTLPSSHAQVKSKTISSDARTSFNTKTPKRPKSLPKKRSTKRVTLNEQVEVEEFQSPDGETCQSDRQDYIEYALDMLTHNLIGSGQLTGAEAHLVKTPELRSHISCLLDKVQASHEVGRCMQIASNTSTHLGAGTSSTMRVGKQWAVQPSRRRNNTGDEKKRTNVLSVPNSPKLVTLNSSPIIKPKPLFQTDHQSRPSTPTEDIPVFEYDKYESQSSIHSSQHSTFTNRAEEPHFRGAGLDERLIDPPYRFKPKIAITSDGGFRAKFDMRGFEDEEITLDLQNRKLTVAGARRKRDGMNERRTVETVEIPVGVDLDQVKVARRLDGILQVQEII